MDIPIVMTERLMLRALRAADLDRFAAMMANPEVVRHLGTGQVRSPAETWDGMAMMLGQWALRGYGMFAIEERASGRFVGRAGVLHPYAWAEPELAYGLDRPFWGMGYATEVARAVRDWAFAGFAPPRLISYVRPANAGSVRVLEKLGARLVDEAMMLGAPAQVWEHRPPA
jgi:RimJ/RimL family protein N-acetyltransferase